MKQLNYSQLHLVAGGAFCHDTMIDEYDVTTGMTRTVSIENADGQKYFLELTPTGALYADGSIAISGAGRLDLCDSIYFVCEVIPGGLHYQQRSVYCF